MKVKKGAPSKTAAIKREEPSAPVKAKKALKKKTAAKDATAADGVKSILKKDEQPATPTKPSLVSTGIQLNLGLNISGITAPEPATPASPATASAAAAPTTEESTLMKNAVKKVGKRARADASGKEQVKSTEKASTTAAASPSSPQKARRNEAKGPAPAVVASTVTTPAPAPTPTQAVPPKAPEAVAVVEAPSVPTPAPLFQSKELQGDHMETLHAKVRRGLEASGVERLTRIQELSYPAMVSNSDVLIRSETGSGKTLAYALPLVNACIVRSETDPITRQAGTLCIVMAPTRELTEQVSAVLTKLTKFCQFLVVGSLHGGEDRHKEKARLRKGIHLLVATPGRLLDHLQTTTSFHHTNLHTIVLDEADRILDMGFERAVQAIMGIIKPKKRVLVSATITKAVERLSHFALVDPVTVGETEDKFEVPDTLRQHYCVVGCKHRLVTLAAFFLSQYARLVSPHAAPTAPPTDAPRGKKILVFVSTSDSAEFHYTLFSRAFNPFTLASRQRNVALDGSSAGVNDEDLAHVQQRTLTEKSPLLTVNVFKLHGNMSQVDRHAVFQAFSNTPSGVLFCTDVAARGLDMPRIDWTVHYDAPSDERCYVHRVGRAARIGNVGDSLLFLMPHERGFVGHIGKFGMSLAERSQHVYLIRLMQMDPGALRRGGAKAGAVAGDESATNPVMHSAAKLQRALNQTVNNDPSLKKMGLFAYQSYVRAYATYPKAVKQWFGVQDLHLGHVATSFGTDLTPHEMQRQLRAKDIAREERDIGRDKYRLRKAGVAVDTSGEYHSTLVARAAKQTKDYLTQRQEQGLEQKPVVGEFDAN